MCPSSSTVAGTVDAGTPIVIQPVPEGTCPATWALFATGVMADLQASTGADPNSLSMTVPPAVRLSAGYGVENLELLSTAQMMTDAPFDGSAASDQPVPRVIQLTFSGVDDTTTNPGDNQNAAAKALFTAMTAVTETHESGMTTRKSPKGLVSCQRWLVDQTTYAYSCTVTGLISLQTSLQPCSVFMSP